jgi:hypothetical protein
MRKMSRVAVCGDDLQGDVGIFRHSDRFAIDCQLLRAFAVYLAKLDTRWYYTEDFVYNCSTMLLYRLSMSFG